MKGILSDKKAISAGIISAVVLTVLRIIQLNTGTEYPSNLYAAGSDALNTVYKILLVVSAAAISILAFFDIKGSETKTADKLSQKSCTAVGIVMILAGAAWILPVINDFSAGTVGIFTITSLAGCIAYLAGGMTIMSSSKIVPAQCISAVFIIINYLIVAVKFYLGSPIITGMPQKLMLMLFYILTILFWINMGRFMCGGEKRFTRTALTASGYFSGACSAAYLISCFALAATDAEKWAQLTDTPDLELIITAFVPAVLAGIVQFSKKRASVQTNDTSDTEQNVTNAEENTSESDTQDVQ
mgnify:FL=1